ncbi:glycosyl transferase family 2 [Paenibacillus chitinolyticus]|uniref:Glycosyl transferase family 2 n=1 Tax=Paenibacillus chitinolyticus TaxID=79263 RepID=A0A410X309_9BACL|nr:glycosyltransferase family 2 protein [Paenibacillus chitinolyticus]MCY9589074.1 glycosyltransferase family 2 protein [Paenibacillus chitinolyticus]MCY9595239.1 glycosyltransferase family 2 protein [Paenibacillus chitinolyticus]QAV20996.1 glycosyl transferase family 2 [Paenibacillus chitinolyticus]
MSIAGILALLILLYWLAMLADHLRGARLFRELPPSGPLPDPTPLVSVIIAAKEEETTIRDTVRHLLAQTYPRLELIVVNDRSQDGTGRTLDELKRWSEEERGDIRIPMRVIHVTRLPGGWLGKNHALYQGYRQARGQWLLFTDADIRFHPDTVREAVGFALSEHADHLTLTPHMTAPTFWLRSFIRHFLFSLSLFTRPWRANLDGERKGGMGIGAFNLIHRRAYEAIGTHEAIALRPDDDLQLGARVKLAGLRQRLASGRSRLQVEWYPSMRAAVRGLEKNLFSGFGYKVSVAAAAGAGQLLLFTFPWLGMLLYGDWRSLVHLASVLIMTALYRKQIRMMAGSPGLDTLAVPASAALLVYVLVRSVGLTLKQGGVYWRGTFYSLSDLKKMK